MKIFNLIFSILIFFTIPSCDFNDQSLEYEDNLVVFSSIVANLPVSDTISVSRSASILEDIQAQELWIDDANVYLINDSTKDTLIFFNVGSGKYFPIPTEPSLENIENYLNYIIQPGQTYHNHKTVKILSYALDANIRGLEPLDSLSSIIDPDSGGFFDYNYNEIRDSVYTNLIYDTSIGFRIWKGPYPRDEENNPYRINPWQWNVETAPTPIMWLYFDYYGLHLMTFRSTSESYFNYFSGDPVGQNIYLLPDSNVEDGLGVFYSNYSSSFVVYVRRDE